MITKKNGYTKEDLAKHLKVTLNGLNQLLNGPGKKTYKIKDPRKDQVLRIGRKFYYSKDYFDHVVKATEGRIQRPSRNRILKGKGIAKGSKSELSLKVKVSNGELISVLLTQFGDKAAITKYLESHLEQLGQAKLEKLKKLKEQYDRKMKEVLKGS